MSLIISNDCTIYPAYVTINTEVKKTPRQSPEFVKIENEKKELMLELDSLKFDIDSPKSRIGK